MNIIQLQDRSEPEPTLHAVEVHAHSEPFNEKISHQSQNEIKELPEQKKMSK